MSWQTYLLVAAVASCWSIVQLHRNLHIITDGLLNQSNYSVCCFFNDSTSKPWDIQLKLENITLETEFVDEFTICSRMVIYAQDKLELRCIWPDNGSTKATITPSSFLRVEFFKCTYSDIKTDLHCVYMDFEVIPGSKLNVTMDNTIIEDCELEEHGITTCKPPYPHHFRGSSHNFTVEDNSLGILRKLVVQLTDDQMKVPYWPTNQPQIERSGDVICVDFSSSAFNKSISYEWTVFVTSQDRSSNTFLKIISYLKAGFEEPKDVCFVFVPSHYDIYKVKLKVRFNCRYAPWLSTYYVLDFKFKPPTFLPHGFHYDSKKKELYVFWEHKDEMFFYEPNSTYIVLTNSGEQPQITAKRFAVFNDWNFTQQATVSLWRRDLIGIFAESSKLKVPSLTNHTRQPRNLRYHFENNTLTWDPPEEEDMLTGFYIYWCPSLRNSIEFCKNHEQLKFFLNSKDERSHLFKEPKGSLNMAVSAIYKGILGGGMKWYVEPTMDPVITESNSFGLIGILITCLIVIALLVLIYVLFQKWKRKKIAEIKISLPPIFDPDVMAKLSLRNVEFPRSPDPPEEISSSSTVPQRIFLHSKETTNIVKFKTDQLAISPDPPDAVSSPYTTIDELPKPERIAQESTPTKELPAEEEQEEELEKIVQQKDLADCQELTIKHS
ncbi:cytokine receptor-like [Drosophila takahashii]|uniref:cytokine receptor-like n=1 Tax=Drosophila takahashii TaxID=29030 RepID=UPI003898D817